MIWIMKPVPENIYLKTCSTSFPRAQNACLHPELSSQQVQGQQLQQHRIQSAEIAEADGKCPCRSVTGKCPWQCQLVVERLPKWS